MRLKGAQAAIICLLTLSGILYLHFHILQITDS